VHVEIYGAGGEFVQVRLPEMRSPTFDQSNVGTSLAAEFVAETSDEFESTGAAADDDDARFAS